MSAIPIRGRGMVPPMEGRHPSSFASKRPLEEPFFGESDRATSTSNYSQNKFMPPEDSYEYEASNQVHSKSDSLVFDNGQRRVTMGRGSHISDCEGPQPNARVTFPDINDDMDTLISTYISRQYKKISTEALTSINCGVPNPLSIIFKLGQCVCCDRPSLYVCTTCKAWYCSNSCRRIDYNHHLKECVPKKVVSFDVVSGDLKMIDTNEKFSDAVEPQESLKLLSLRDERSNNQRGLTNEQKPSDSKPFQKPSSPSHEPPLSKPHPSYDRSYDNNSDRNHYYNGQESNNDYDKRDRGPRGGGDSGSRGGGGGGHGGRASYSNRGGANNNRGYEDRRSGGDSGGRPPRNENSNNNLYSRRNQRDSQARNQEFQEPTDSFDGPEEQVNEPPVRNARVHPPRINNVENGVYKKTSDASAESSPRTPAATSSRNAANLRGPEPPIPNDKFSEVTVSALANEKGRFWAYSKDVEALQAEIMEELGAHSAKAKCLTSKLTPGLKVSAPFCGDWYRAEVKNISSDGTVNVFFLDFGNEISVEKKDIFPLPLAVASKPILAHLYVLAESGNNPEVIEESKLMLKPVRWVDGAWACHAEGATYKESEYTEEVTILVTERDDGEFWVRNVSDDDLLDEMTETLGEHSTIKVVATTLDEIYAINFYNLWFRSKVINRYPLTVFQIDTGIIKEGIRKSDMHPLPYKYTSIRPLAFKIKLTGGEEMDYLIKEGDKIYINVMQKMEDVSICEFRGRSTSSRNYKSNKKPMKYVLNSLDQSSGALRFERQLNEEVLTGSVISEEKTPIFEELADTLMAQVKLDKIKLSPGLMVAAKWNNQWHRGYIMVVRGIDAMVALIDRGRVVVPEAVAALPSTINNVPLAAVRVFLKRPTNDIIKAGSTFRINASKLINDKVQVEIENLGEGYLLPWEPMLEEAGLNSSHLRCGSKVIISAFSSPTSVYLHSMEEDDIISRSELFQDVASHSLLCESLERRPMSGELLAVRYTDGQYYRAQIFKRQGERYKVIFVDFGNTDLVKVSDMKPLPDSLKSLPCCGIKVGLKGVPDEPFNNNCVRYLNVLTANNTNFTVTYDRDDLSNVILDFPTGDNLNTAVLDLMTPTWKKKNFNVAASDVFTEANLEFEKWEKGSKFEVALVKVMRHNLIAVLRRDSSLLGHIDSTLTPNISKYCESFDTIEAYIPRVDEVCLALFEDDGKWYRAVARKQYQRNSTKIFFLDYGNSGIALHKNIRKMVSDFMTTPVALKFCKIYGIPENVSPDVNKRLTDYLSQHEKYDAIVVEETDHETTIWIPELEKKASILGLEIKPPTF